MNAIAATRRTYKELVDGTLRIQFDVEPKDKAAFLALFPNIDMPCALVPLIPGFEQAGDGTEEHGDGFDSTNIKSDPIGQIATFSINDAEAKTIGGSTWATLGPLCQSSIELCKHEAFQKWVLSKVGVGPRGHEVSVEVAAADFIRERCQVGSRKDLDTDPDAKTRFGALMADYREWLNVAH